MEKEKQILAIGYYHQGVTIIMFSNTQHREIAISQLPDTCSMKTRLSYWVSDTNKSSVVVIASCDTLGTWKAYIGYPSLSDVQDSLRNNPLIQYHCTNIHHRKNVLAYGDVLDQETAEYLFPEWKDKKYST